MAGFRNTLYKDAWKKHVGDSTKDYADGTYFEEGDGYAVYDGGQNLMGYINKAGVFSAAGPLNEYAATFLREAKAELVKQGLVAAMSGDDI